MSYKKIAAGIALAVFFICLDRFFKVVAAQGISFKILGQLLRFDYVGNQRIAFSLPLDGGWLFVLSGAIVLFLIIALVLSAKKHAFSEACFLLFIILGAASNLYDRFCYGAVIDYLDLKYFTVFNLADVMIVGGAIGMLYIILTAKKEL